MKKPMIALTARSGDFDGQTRIFDNQTYFDAIAQAGGIPVLVTYGDDEDYKMIAERFDGLMVTGGEDLDPALLARAFELSGASIKNAALHGALLAAAEGTEVQMRHLMDSIRNEYEKQGKNFSASQRELLDAFR